MDAKCSQTKCPRLLPAMGVPSFTSNQTLYVVYMGRHITSCAWSSGKMPSSRHGHAGSKSLPFFMATRLWTLSWASMEYHPQNSVHLLPAQGHLCSTSADSLACETLRQPATNQKLPIVIHRWVSRPM
eukprot:c20548_g1_i1 orf=127-510(+)